MARGEMGVPKHHAEELPAPKLLDGPEVHASHNKPAGEAVAVRVPSVAFESAGVLPLCTEPGLSLSDCVREETRHRSIRSVEDRLFWIVRPLPLSTEIEKSR